jgi:hypothetical protein
MEPIENVHARSASVIIEGETAVLSFLAAIDGHPNVAVSMRVHDLEQLQSRISRALDVRKEQSQPE